MIRSCVLAHLPVRIPLTRLAVMTWTASLFAGAGEVHLLECQVIELMLWLDGHEGTGQGVWS